MAANITPKEAELSSKQTTNKTFTTSPLGSNSSIQSLTIDSIHPNFMMRNNCFIRRGVPESHRKVADNYMIIKKVFGSPVIQSKLTEEEYALLQKYDFSPLEFTTSKQVEDELIFLKKWSYSRNRDLQIAADFIIQIRAKELKYLVAKNYIMTNQRFDGYKILDKYFEEISKYFSRG